MAEARVECRLAAVLAADVPGYSCLMGADDTCSFESAPAWDRRSARKHPESCLLRRRLPTISQVIQSRFVAIRSALPKRSG